MDSSSRNFCIYRSKLLHYRWETGLGSPSAFLSRLTRELHAQPIRLISTPFLKINRHITRKFLIYPFDFFFFFFFTGIFSPIWLANLYDLVPARVVRLFYGRVNSQMRDLKVKGSGQLVILDDLDRLVGEQIRRVFPLHPVRRIVPAMHIVSGHILWRKRLFSSSPKRNYLSNALSFGRRRIINWREDSPDSSTRNRNTWCDCCKSRRTYRTPCATGCTGACGIPCAISQLTSSRIPNLVNAPAIFLCAMEDRVARHHESHPLASLIIIGEK